MFTVSCWKYMRWEGDLHAAQGNRMSELSCFLKWENRAVKKWMYYSRRYERDVSLLRFWIIRGKWELQWDASANFFHYNLCLFSITLAQHTLSAKCTYLCKWKQKSLLFSGKDVVGTSRKLPLFVNLRVHLQWWYNILIFFRGLGFLHNLQQIFLHVFFSLVPNASESRYSCPS